MPNPSRRPPLLNFNTNRPGVEFWKDRRRKNERIQVRKLIATRVQKWTRLATQNWARPWTKNGLALGPKIERHVVPNLVATPALKSTLRSLKNRLLEQSSCPCKQSSCFANSRRARNSFRKQSSCGGVGVWVVEASLLGSIVVWGDSAFVSLGRLSGCCRLLLFAGRGDS